MFLSTHPAYLGSQQLAKLSASSPRAGTWGITAAFETSQMFAAAVLQENEKPIH